MALKYIHLSLFVLILIISTIGCDREQQIPIPYVYVNHTVYLSNPTNYHLQTPGNYLIIPEIGNMGVILYRRTIGEPDDFIAFDLTCTHEPLESCILSVDDTNFYLECPCCVSRFSIWDGFVAEAPARWPLKQYETSFNGTTIRIYN